MTETAQTCTHNEAGYLCGNCGKEVGCFDCGWEDHTYDTCPNPIGLFHFADPMEASVFNKKKKAKEPQVVSEQLEYERTSELEGNEQEFMTQDEMLEGLGSGLVIPEKEVHHYVMDSDKPSEIKETVNVEREATKERHPSAGYSVLSDEAIIKALNSLGSYVSEIMLGELGIEAPDELIKYRASGLAWYQKRDILDWPQK